jgi:hypothetical protein
MGFFGEMGRFLWVSPFFFDPPEKGLQSTLCHFGVQKCSWVCIYCMRIHLFESYVTQLMWGFVWWSVFPVLWKYGRQGSDLL